MKKNLTEMVFILDRSGSMCGMEDDTIGGFNAMIEKQKKVAGEAYVTTVLFNETVQMIHDRVSVQSVKAMTRTDYEVQGCTALLDAMGSTIKHIAGIHKYARKKDVPEHTIFVITTDGMENASHTYDAAQVRTLIETMKKKHGWEFLFLGANIDAIETAQSVGIQQDRAVNFLCDSAGTRLNYEVVGAAIEDIRGGEELELCWKAPIEEDYASRQEN